MLLAASTQAWEWLARDRMPGGDFAGYAAEVQHVRDTLLGDGRLPDWCAGCYGGTTRFTSHLKELLTLPLALALEPVLATKLAWLGLRVLAALGLYGLMVRWFRAPAIGAVAGYAFAFSAVSNHQLAHLDMALAAALLPPSLLASVEVLRRGRPPWIVALGALLAVALMNNWVYALPIPLLVLLLAVARPWRRDDGEPALAQRWPGRLAAALLLFLVFAASQLAWIASDARHHQLIPQESIERYRSFYSERSPFLLMNRDNALASWLADHQPAGLDLPRSDAGRRYLGIGVLAVCLVGGFAARRSSQLRRWRNVAALAFLLQYWLALGPRTLLWQVGESLHWSPELQASLRTALLVAACAGVAAAGVWRARAKSSSRWPGRLLAIALLSSFPTLSLWSLAAQLFPPLQVQRSPGHFFEAAPFWLALLFGVSLVALTRHLGRRTAHAVVALVALAVAVDFWPSRRAFAAGEPMAPLRRAAERMRGLPAENASVRIGLPYRYSPLDSWLVAQSPAGHAWGWLRWQAGEHWGPMIEPMLASLSARPLDRERIRRVDTPLLASARVRYLLREENAPALPQPWKLVRSPLRRYAIWEQPVAPMASGYRAYRIASADADPHARVAEALAEDMLTIAGPFDAGPPRSAGRAEPLPVELRRPSPEQIVLGLDAGPAPALVLVREAYHPWWRAESDGARLPVLRAQLALMAIPVDPGRHTIELRLVRPAWVAVADTIGAGSWIALAVTAPVTWLRSRRRSLPTGMHGTPAS